MWFLCVQVAALRQLQKQELIDFFEEYIKIGAARKKSLSIRVYESQHLKEKASDKSEVPSPSVEIEDNLSTGRLGDADNPNSED